MYLKAARHMNVSPHDCLTLNGSPAGVAAAANAHMCPIGVGAPEGIGPYGGWADASDFVGAGGDSNSGTPRSMRIWLPISILHSSHSLLSQALARLPCLFSHLSNLKSQKGHVSCQHVMWGMSHVNCRMSHVKCLNLSEPLSILPLSPNP
eukprot:CAMPEP_0173124540 /NCGR_PEP_ID=MMETSP1102-20130122/55723_1 /TAXON_ID=49646 /ORGANISM="Geminigera sp., Strain Caron Lab Isolate" /LENGTH=149 /DNA_ID=CAMNT_0014032919 /DNA_START=130 /DNA_END=579 /DNA_ORIENTATION=-